MRSVTHREMRNNSAELLRRVEAGESVMITNHGKAAAVISPAGHPPIEVLVERGHVRVAIRGAESLTTIARRRGKLTSRQILDDSRRSW
ncbi:MAG TPA: type II toxin-antitoxin system prevent-host-death family antitoxin [Microbacterium sp.]|uniref:type II toxin-antitoxin system Phd/YefM family antitoxin n=1 Tax=Microbacterium sp. TaxID=51671 RepID=UPI002C01765D|nr:type II toxin-antitoxin system prevent-host-death family antitoxin [Microbacterium sp.]HWI31376.1 type II toxin-antitoxin system prevent-host-death family antitoxin [Microbacterium sp.]